MNCQSVVVSYSIFSKVWYLCESCYVKVSNKILVQQLKHFQVQLTSDRKKTFSATLHSTAFHHTTTTTPHRILPSSTTLHHTPPHSTTLHYTPPHSTTLHHTPPTHLLCNLFNATKNRRNNMKRAAHFVKLFFFPVWIEVSPKHRLLEGKTPRTRYLQDRCFLCCTLLCGISLPFFWEVCSCFCDEFSRILILHGWLPIKYNWYTMNYLAAFTHYSGKFFKF